MNFLKESLEVFFNEFSKKISEGIPAINSSWKILWKNL